MRRDLLRRAQDAREQRRRAVREWGPWDEDGEIATAHARQAALREAARMLRGVS